LKNRFRLVFLIFGFCCLARIFAQGILVDHRHTDIRQIPETAVQAAKIALVIAYGHTSHGSQLVDGMSGLVSFMNGLDYPNDLYTFNRGGSNAALDFRDTPFSGAEDLGNPDFTSWATATRNYLNTHPAVKVVIWSWCGQVSWASAGDINTYLNLMSALESDFPTVNFVYMTGHLDGTGGTGNLNTRNQQIRDYCTGNDKILFDFADIESYDPDGQTNYMVLGANDNCDYDADGDGNQESNWAIAWQNSHTQGTDWYDCGSAHSQPLNANRKAYAAWWLWARIAGWPGPSDDMTPPSVPQNLGASSATETAIGLVWNASSDAESGVSHYSIYRNGAFAGSSSQTAFIDQGLIPGTTYIYTVTAVNGAGLESVHSNSVQRSTVSDNESPSAPGNLTAVPVSDSQIRLSWAAASDNAGIGGYLIYRNGMQVGSTESLDWTDSGLNASTQYSYQISAYDAAGNESGLSAAVIISTMEPSPEILYIRLEDQSGEVEDTFIYQINPDANFGAEPYMDEIDHFLIRFNLPGSLSDKQILSANLGLYVWNQVNYQPDQYMEIYPLSRHWDADQATWNHATAGEPWQRPGGDYIGPQPAARILHQQGSENWDHTFYPEADLTSVVQQWVDGILENHGLLIRNHCATGIGLKASEYGKGSCPYLLIRYTSEMTAVRQCAISAPDCFFLYGNYPNPFNPSTVIIYAIPQQGEIALSIYDLKGRFIKLLLNGFYGPGLHQAEWNGTDEAGLPVSSGHYFYRLSFKKQYRTGKAFLLR
jgi:chitodextrinase